MEHNEPWQTYSENGQSRLGHSATKDQFVDDTTLIMGASHVWVWRKQSDTIELLVQKRAATKKTWPGFKDVSAAGHIDANETAVTAAIRETKEEIGLSVNADYLYYIFSLRTPLDDREFDTVFLYKLDIEPDFVFEDGEVESLEWVELTQFEKMTKIPDEYQLVPQGNEYFALLIASIKRISE